MPLLDTARKLIFGLSTRVALAVAAICALAAAPECAFARSATVDSELAASLQESRDAFGDFYGAQLDPLLSDLEQRTFRFFWETANPKNGLIPERYPTPSYASIAAVGFGLTAYPNGVERGYTSRTDAQRRVLATLRYFVGAPNQHGFFYHFVDLRSGARASDSEVSTVDTALLLAGMLFCENYFDTLEPRDVEIRKLTDEIYARVDWRWAQPRPPAVALAWTPETGFSQDDWRGYNEAMLVYLLALGSPTHPIERQAWMSWTSTYDQHWGALYDQTHLGFLDAFNASVGGPSGHQSAAGSVGWVDSDYIGIDEGPILAMIATAAISCGA